MPAHVASRPTHACNGRWQQRSGHPDVHCSAAWTESCSALTTCRCAELLLLYMGLWPELQAHPRFTWHRNALWQLIRSLAKKIPGRKCHRQVTHCAMPSTVYSSKCGGLNEFLSCFPELCILLWLALIQSPVIIHDVWFLSFQSNFSRTRTTFDTLHAAAAASPVRCS